MSRYAFDFAGREYTEGEFGPDYVPEFTRMIDAYLPRPPRSIREWGTGITSLVLLERAAQWNTDLFLTIDTNAEYQQAVFGERPVPALLDARCLDTIGPRATQSDPEYTYSSLPLSLGRKFDLIIVDGRRRVECAYIAALVSHEDTLVLLHDYRRARYQSILAVYDVVEDGNQFRALRVRRELLIALASGSERVAAVLPAMAADQPLWRRRLAAVKSRAMRVAHRLCLAGSAIRSWRISISTWSIPRRSPCTGTV
jgi:hypothetical protein